MVDSFLTRRLAAFILALGWPALLLAGDLTPPPGPVSPTMLPLTQVEPRTPLSAATTPGDAASVFRITQPGSYYLTGDLTGVAGRNGLVIAATDVTIDLMGFSLRGVPGSLSGVHAATGEVRVTIRNGVVRGWGNNGITLFNAGGVIDSVQAYESGFDGLQVGPGSVVRGCVATSNGFSGIAAGVGSVIENCVARLNGSTGIFANSRSTVTRCVAEGNGGAGFRSAFGTLFVDCAAGENQGFGFDVNLGVMVDRCVSSRNGGHGILAGIDCVITSNLCFNNGLTSEGSGIHVISPDTRVEGNTCTDNDWGIRSTSTGGIFLRNSCTGNTSGNWNIVAGNVCLVVNAATNPAAIVGNSGGLSPGSTDPGANFSY